MRRQKLNCYNITDEKNYSFLPVVFACHDLWRRQSSERSKWRACKLANGIRRHQNAR